MKCFYIIFYLFISISLSIGAQNKNALTQAKTYYSNKEYSKALPIFEKEYLAKPTDPSLNLWYGVCLVETGGDIKKAEQCLLVASKKFLPESYLYLGDMYVKEYRLSEAEDFYARYTKALPKQKDAVMKRMQDLDKMKRFISRTEDIQVIDSLVIDKADFLSAYKLSPSAGTLTYYNKEFPSKQKVESVVYTNGKGSKIYFGQLLEGHYVLSTMDKLLNGFGNEDLISVDNFGLTGDVNYPFVLQDGTTIYFSGKDVNGVGGYDIYVTRYNLKNNSYLAPELLNMPFNSTANDYMMVYDEYKGIGWFATDRFQPENKVCIYTFIPNDMVTLLDSDDELYRERRARLTSIKETWKEGKDYSSTISLAEREVQPVEEKIFDFTFIINDDKTYHSYSDFKSRIARDLLYEVHSKINDFEINGQQLESLRDEFSKASAGRKKYLTERIIDLEKKQNSLYREIKILEMRVRNEEIKLLK